MGEPGLADRLDHELELPQPGSADPSAEVRELAVLASRLQAALAPGPPALGFLQASPTRLLRQLESPRGRGRSQAPSLLRPSWALAALALMLAVAPVGLAYASDSALPGDGLYPVKRGFESLRLAVAWTPAADAALRAAFADERLGEILGLIDAQREQEMARALAEYDDALADYVEGAEGAPLEDASARLNRHLDVLREEREMAQGEARTHLDRALERSSHALEVLKALQEGRSPSELAPGRIRRTQEPSEVPSGRRLPAGEDPRGQAGNQAGRWRGRFSPTPTPSWTLTPTPTNPAPLATP